jgi:hypothetical protein
MLLRHMRRHVSSEAETTYYFNKISTVLYSCFVRCLISGRIVSLKDAATQENDKRHGEAVSSVSLRASRHVLRVICFPIPFALSWYVLMVCPHLIEPVCMAPDVAPLANTENKQRHKDITAVCAAYTRMKLSVLQNVTSCSLQVCRRFRDTLLAASSLGLTLYPEWKRLHVPPKRQ